MNHTPNKLWTAIDHDVNRVLILVIHINVYFGEDGLFKH